MVNAKGLDPRDHVLGKVVCRHIIHQLRRQQQQGKLLIDGKRQATIIWRLPEVKTLL